MLHRHRCLSAPGRIIFRGYCLERQPRLHHVTVVKKSPRSVDVRCRLKYAKVTKVTCNRECVGVPEVSE